MGTRRRNRKLNKKEKKDIKKMKDEGIIISGHEFRRLNNKNKELERVFQLENKFFDKI